MVGRSSKRGPDEESNMEEATSLKGKHQEEKEQWKEHIRGGESRGMGSEVKGGAEKGDYMMTIGQGRRLDMLEESRGRGRGWEREYVHISAT